MTGLLDRPEGPVPNPYFAGTAADAGFKPFSHESLDIFLVTRLDGFSVDDVLKLIDQGDRARFERPAIVLDGRPSWQDKGNAWLRDAAMRSGPPATTARWSSTTPPKLSRNGRMCSATTRGARTTPRIKRPSLRR